MEANRSQKVFYRMLEEERLKEEEEAEGGGGENEKGFWTLRISLENCLRNEAGWRIMK